MNSVFSEQILADKLSKLNSTQQCIETLSHWCIFHQGKADQVVMTWDKQFHSSEMTQKVPLLYLANDILQNSKRKGNEFVTEFWKVLPGALKDIVENGDDRGKNVVSRLVNIWEERRVFGSHGKSLRDVMLGEAAPPALEFSKKRSRSVKIMKRDSRSIRTKLVIGGSAEKIVSAFHSVASEHPNEDVEMSKCKSAIARVRKMEKEVNVACTSGEDSKREILAKELEKEENLLRQCIEKLKSAEASRATLVFQLKEALQEQESEVENVRTQMQVAQAQADELIGMQKRLKGEEYTPNTSTTSNGKAGDVPKKTAAAIAAEVADKLAASSSSQFIMHSVLSSFAAEEAKNAVLSKASTPSKADNTLPISDVSTFTPTQPLPPSSNHSYQSVMFAQPSTPNQASSPQTQFHVLPNMPTQQQFMQPSGAVMTPYGFSGMSPLPSGPPPAPPYMVSPMVPMAQQPPQMIQQQMHLQAPIGQQQQLTLSQQPRGPGYRPLQPPGMAYYGQPPRP